MEFKEKVVKNLKKILSEENLFVPATDEQIRKLEELVGKKVEKFIDFYQNYQPYKMPMLDCYVQLLDIDNIIMENTYGEPGKYLAQYGVYVFALTAGGNVLCIDTNDIHHGDASVLIAEADFCFYNESLQCIEISNAPEKVFDMLEDDEVLVLNYPNIKKSLCKLEKSFAKFMLKLSKNKYEDVEEYLDFD